MRIEFLTEDNPLYVLPFFQEFFQACPAEIEVLQVSSSRAMGKRPRIQLLRELLSLYGVTGSMRIGSEIARAHLFSPIPRGRGAGRYDTLAQLCRSYAISYSAITTPNDSEFLRGARKRAADAIISVACPYILGRDLLSLPVRGCINIHHAPLPRYKGMMPTFWQMFNGERTVGITIHYMSAKVDEGPALFQDSLEIVPGESLDHLIKRSKRHGAQCMVRVLRELQAGTQRAVPLDAAESTYFTFPTIEEIRQFHRRGLRAI
ncbi:MAG: formyltransferase family protein [Candidatus Acidiferrum sp.]